jgi:hypothetical protein
MTAKKRSKWFFLVGSNPRCCSSEYEAIATSGVFFQTGSRASWSGVAARP